MSNVTTFNPNLSTEDRAIAAVQALNHAIAELKKFADTGALYPFRMELDRADTDISLLKTRVSMRRSTIHLCSQFGRAP